LEVLACPHCLRLFHATPAALGKKIRCRGCRQIFHVPRDTSSVPLGAAVHAAANGDEPRVAIACVKNGRDTRRCPQCAREFLMKPAFVGKTIRCRGCKASFRVAATEYTLPSPMVSDDVGKVMPNPPANERVLHAVRPCYAQLVQRHSNSPMAGLVAVVLGGLCALPMTQLILWWGFAKDPIKLAGSIPHALQWLVPLNLRP